MVISMHVFWTKALHFTYLILSLSSPGTGGKEPSCQCKRCKRRGFNPWVGNIPWSRKWQLTPVFQPVDSHGQRSLEATVHRVAGCQTRLERSIQSSFLSFFLSSCSCSLSYSQDHKAISPYAAAAGSARGLPRCRLSMQLFWS